jgi:hypothetical protein
MARHDCVFSLLETTIEPKAGLGMGNRALHWVFEMTRPYSIAVTYSGHFLTGTKN